MLSPLTTPFEMERYLVIPSRNRILRGARAVAVQPKVMDLLCLLAAEPGRTATRGELREGVWRGVVVGEAAIDRAVCCLRRALRDDARAPRFVETVRKRGVRLRVAVRPAAAPPPTDHAGLTQADLVQANLALGTLRFRYEQPSAAWSVDRSRALAHELPRRNGRDVHALDT